MVKTAEAVGNVSLDEPGCPGPFSCHLTQGGVAATAGTETVRAAGEPRLIIGLQQEADYLAHELIRPRRQAQRSHFPVLLGNVDPLYWPEPVALVAQRIDDAPDPGQRHAVHGLPVGPWRHRPMVGVQPPVSQQVQIRVEQLPVQLLTRQAAPATLTPDIQHRFGALHYAYLPVLRYPVTWPPSPCG